LSLGSGEFVAVAEADAEADEEADADAEVEDEAVADSEAAVEALSEPEAEADASEVALEPQAASKAMELTPSTPSAARRVRFSDIVIPFSQSVIATSLAANPTGYRVEWTKREKRLTDKSVMTNYDAAEVADASAEAAAEEGAAFACETGVCPHAVSEIRAMGAKILINLVFIFKYRRVSRKLHCIKPLSCLHCIEAQFIV